MTSRIEIGLKSGRSSTEVLRHMFGMAAGRDVAVRVSYQLFVPGERAYVGLRDHTTRFKVRSRRDFEDIHGKVVQFVEDLLDRKYGRHISQKHDRRPTDLMTPEQDDAIVANLAATEADEDAQFDAAVEGDAEPPGSSDAQ